MAVRIRIELNWFGMELNRVENNEGKTGKHVYLRDWTQKWHDRLSAFVDWSYFAIAGAGVLLAMLALLAS